MITISDSHPDVLAFCRVKRNLDKVRHANISVRVTDAFMRAVERDGDWLLRYENADDRIEVTRVIKARALWDALISGARDAAEPGCLFWDTVQRFSSSDRYPGMAVVSTNPCVTGDTLVAVADGRLHVPIAQLAAAGVDVPVYCRDNTTGELCIRWMRHPRKTGTAVPVYRVRLDDGSSIRATADHKFLLGTGEYRAVCALQPGDSLRLLTRFAASLAEVLEQGRSQDDYYWLCADGRTQAEHHVIAAFFGHPLRRGEYDCRVIDGHLYLAKHCEMCRREFLVCPLRREQGTCSYGCAMRLRWQQGLERTGWQHSRQRRRER